MAGHKDEVQDSGGLITSLAGWSRADEPDVRCRVPESNESPGRGKLYAWRQVLREFGENTTIAGVRQIAEDSPFCARRVIWSLIVCLCFAAFFYQVIYSVLYFLEAPVSVDLRVIYNNTIIFPAVTLCNQNAFRLTAVKEANLYSTIEKIFSKKRSSPEEVELFPGYNGNISLSDLYLKTAHAKHDLILRCLWDGKPCSPDNFTTVITDFGVCYTFNYHRDLTLIQTSSVSGANRGLRLTLNIEQYEYTTGPNTGAGLKLLVHSQNEIPRMRDLGVAVPPGSYALAAVSMMDIYNMAPPHGVCNDSVTLRSFGHYSESACHTQCRADWLIQKCLCRDMYLPHSRDDPPVCTLDEFVRCGMPAMESFASTAAEDRCMICPVPCHRHYYATSLTYAAISNFEIDSLQRSPHIKHIKDSYIRAKETFYRVDEYTKMNDVITFASLHNILENITLSMSSFKHNVDFIKTHVKEMMRELLNRLKFHYESGLLNVKYLVHHNYIRGFDIIAERALDHITKEMYEIKGQFDSLVQHSNNSRDNTSRVIVAKILNDRLAGIQYLCERALLNITEVDEAFRTGRRLLNFRKTPMKGRYDKNFALLPFLFHDPKRQEDEFKYLILSLHNMILSINSLRTIATHFGITGQADVALYRQFISQFIDAGKMFNYRRFQYRDKVIYKSETLVDDVIETFQKTDKKCREVYNKCLRIFDLFQDSFTSYNLQSGDFGVQSFLPLVLRYLKADKEITRYSLSDIVKSKRSREGLLSFSKFFTDVRILSKELGDTLEKYQQSYGSAWDAMLAERSTHTFYQAIRNDLADHMLNGKRFYNFTDVVASMTGRSFQDIRDMSDTHLVVITNADFPVLNHTQQQLNTSRAFSEMLSSIQVESYLNNQDAAFIKVFDHVRAELLKYSASLQIDSSFLRSNLVKIDVFMKEINYQRVKQQAAYDMIQLWSDIGGSAGLFIGATVITVFEICDVIILNCFVINLKKSSGRVE